MCRVRRILCSIVILATAASSLLANVPIAVCACVSRPAHQSETSETAKPGTCCCCGNNCCTPADEEPCCDRQTQDSKEDGSGAPTITRPNCHLTATHQEAVSIEQRHADVGEMIADCSNVAPLDCLQEPVSHALFDHALHDPPPINLVVTLQHFLN